MALPITTRMSRSAKRARKSYLDAMRESALEKASTERTLADTMNTLGRTEIEHKYFAKEIARLDHVTKWLKKEKRGMKNAVLEEKLRKNLEELRKFDAANRGYAASMRKNLGIAQKR